MMSRFRSTVHGYTRTHEDVAFYYDVLVQQLTFTGKFGMSDNFFMFLLSFAKH